MDDPSVRDRLTHIRTRWSLLAQAHTGDEAARNAARAALVERYQTAVYRYLLACVRDPEAADELFQEFALKLVRGDFARADPERGRFRGLVKTALINLVINDRKKQARRRVTGGDAVEQMEAEAVDPDAEFLAAWRKALLDRAWQSLESVQQTTRAPYFDVLRMRSENPQLTAAEIACRLKEADSSARTYSEPGVRKILQRGRELFSDLVVEEVARTLDDPSHDNLEQELVELGLSPWCRAALERRRRE